MISLLFGLTIATTVHPLALLVQEIAGPRVTVFSLIPPGQSPHTYDPRPQDFARLEVADLVIAVGGNLDPWLKHPKRLDLMKAMGLDDGQTNPHIWLSFQYAAQAASVITKSLRQQDPEGDSLYQQRFERFQTRLHKLQKTYRGLLDSAPPVILYHPAWEFLLSELGIRVVGVVEHHESSEPSPKALAFLIRRVRTSEAKLLILDASFPSVLSQTILQETSLDTVFLDPLGWVYQDTLLSDLLEHNLQHLAEKLLP